MSTFRLRWQKIVFGTDTPAGRRFDELLIVVILASVLAVMLDSVSGLHERFGPWFYGLEWVFTLLFTLEYGLRIWLSDRPLRYVLSFYGLVDLAAVIPTYLSVVLPGANYLLTIRVLRVLRIFRVLKLVQFMGEASILWQALVASRRKISIFLFSVSVLITVFGSLMYTIEGPAHGFTSIPRSIYWAVVTITTVGYGDISPQTNLGQALAALVMILGYAIIAVPTGIVTVELSSAIRGNRTREGKQDLAIGSEECVQCGLTGHEMDARYCRRCGSRLRSGTAS